MKRVIESRSRTPLGGEFGQARLKTSAELIELEPFGVTGGMDKSRPVMLFREIGGEAVLPVWMSAVDAGIALNQHGSQTVAMSPHDLTLRAFEQLGLKPEACHFVELRGHQQYVEVKFSGSRKLRELKVRADFAISFCLQAKVKFYCTRDFLARCRELESEMGRNLGALKNRMHAGRGRQFYMN